MDIRLRSLCTHKISKIIAFVLTIVTLIIAILIVAMAGLRSTNMESLIQKQYKESNSYEKEVEKALSFVVKLYYNDDSFTNVPYYYRVKYYNYVYTNTQNINVDLYHPENEYYTLQNNIWRADSGEEVMRTYISGNMTGYVLFPREFFHQKQQEWSENRAILINYMIAALFCTVIGLLFMIYLIIFTGRHAEDEGIHLHSIDKLFSDLLLAIFLLLLYVFIKLLPLIIRDDHSVGIRIDWYWYDVFTDFKNDFLPSLLLVILISAFFLVVILSSLLALARVIKAGRFLNNCFIYKLSCYLKQVFTACFRYVFYGNVFREESLTRILYYRQLVIIISTVTMFLLAILFTSLESPFIILPVLLQSAVIFWYAKGNQKMFSDIETNIQESLNEQIKSERMKIALITNVSHDLKTPLTSIISYIDLLSREEWLSEAAMDYIKVLQGKSDRLKNIVNDLFDLAKSTSGAIKLDYEVMDLKRLVEQTLVEMEDKIDESGLVIKTKLPDSEVTICNDGKKLYRVLQNLLDNALKYSLEGTRIYIELDAGTKEAALTIKNIAGYEMNFTSEEILQRFNRGDKARSKEGSGLGLSIAESFTKVCGGDFQIEIDGDLFKVKIVVPIYEPSAAISIA